MTAGFELKLRTFIKEFPWLCQHADAKKITEIKVSRISHNLLHRRQRVADDPHEVSPSYDPAWFERILLLDIDGNLIANVGHIAKQEKAFWQWHSPNNGWEAKSAETISDTLISLGERSGDVFYVVTICDTGGSITSGKDDVVIYKPPKGFTLCDWRTQVERAHSNALQQQLAAIDRVDAA